MSNYYEDSEKSVVTDSVALLNKENFQLNTEGIIF